MDLIDCDTPITNRCGNIHPRISEIIDYVLPQLKILQDSDDTLPKNTDVALINQELSDISLVDSERAKAIRLLKTVLKWLAMSFHITQIPARESFYKLLPIVCRLENSEQDAELGSDCGCFIGCLAQSYHPSHMLKDALKCIENVSPDFINVKVKSTKLCYILDNNNGRLVVPLQCSRLFASNGVP